MCTCVERGVKKELFDWGDNGRSYIDVTGDRLWWRRGVAWLGVRGTRVFDNLVRYKQIEASIIIIVITKKDLHGETLPPGGQDSFARSHSPIGFIQRGKAHRGRFNLHGSGKFLCELI